MVSQFTAMPVSGELQKYLKLADAALRSGDMPRAMAIGQEASDRGLEHPNLLVLASYREINAGSLEKALVRARRAQELAPHNGEVLQALASALAQNGRQKEALPIYEAALRKQPGIAALRYNRGCLLESMFETVRARRDFERVLELDPGHAGAAARIAAIAVANNEIDAARSYATRALKLNPGETAAVIVLAQADLLEKKYDEVIARMKPLTAPQHSAVNRSMAEGLIADALDAVDKKSGAFAAYASSNAVLRQSVANVFEAAGTETAIARAQRTAAFVRSATIDWTSPPQASPVKTHVFLLGFPRSGTTLLENVLASHPAIEAMEERDGLMEAEAAIMGSQDGLEHLAVLSAAEIDRYRSAYWAEMESGGARFDRDVFIDKMPLNSLLLPIIARLFPGSRILLAIRDPRDVVLSCFRRRFGMSAKMYPMLSLDGTAKFYDAAMQICGVARAKFPMPFRVIRYEDLVNGFDEETKALCDFLGVAHGEDMKNFADRARGRLVNTPSAPQVSQGLYTQGLGQWRAYRAQMAPVLSVLAPWVKEFGYAEE
jgi:tetratricopeptide (TPR) repeat protein